MVSRLLGNMKAVLGFPRNGNMKDGGDVIIYIYIYLSKERRKEWERFILTPLITKECESKISKFRSFRQGEYGLKKELYFEFKGSLIGRISLSSRKARHFLLRPW